MMARRKGGTQGLLPIEHGYQRSNDDAEERDDEDEVPILFIYLFCLATVDVARLAL